MTMFFNKITEISFKQETYSEERVKRVEQLDGFNNNID